MTLYLLVQQGFPSQGRFMSHFQEDREEGQSVLFAQPVSQVPLIQTNRYAKAAYFRMQILLPFNPKSETSQRS